MTSVAPASAKAFPPYLFEALLEISEDVIWSYHYSSASFHWSAASGTYIKYGLGNISNLDQWREKIHPDDVARVSARHRAAINDCNCNSLDISYRLQTHGGYILIRDKQKFIRDETGRILQSIGLWRELPPDHINTSVHDPRHQLLTNEIAVRQVEIAATVEELRQTNEQLTANYQQLFEHEFILNRSQQLAKIGSWQYEYNTGKFYWSDEMYSIYGIDESVDINDVPYLITLFSPSSQHFIKEVLQNILNQTRQDFEGVVEIVTPLGYKKWLRIAGYHPDGKTGQHRMIGITHDITYYKEAEVRLRSSEEKFSKAFNNNPDPMILIRQKDLIIIDANKKTLPVFGYSPYELLGSRFTAFNFLADANDTRLPWHNEDVAYSEFECSWRKKNGSFIHVLLSCSLVEIESTRTYIVDLKDITARKEAEEKLRMSEANLRATMNNTSVMVWSVDRHLKLVMMNRAFADYVKVAYNIPAIQVTCIPDQVNAQLLTRWQYFYKRALSGETFSASEEWNGKQIDYSLNPIIENGVVVGVSVFAEDVSEKISQQRELADTQRTLAEYKLMALRSVMNPHFVFNALNSIQFFITKNDRLNAINYLSTFSKLIRGILYNAKNNQIKLADEIELLKHYVELELLRFENKFDFMLQIDPAVDVENIEIQTLLIQPFVENAILHGLYNTTRRGELKIIVENAPGDRGILFTIKDNGIGREAARALRQKTSPGHKSVGISLTQERLKLINNNDSLSVQIIDDMDGNTALGTTVKISVRI